MKKIKAVKKPFFAKFLEAQQIEKLKSLKGGKGPMTLKAPSDNDEI